MEKIYHVFTSGKDEWFTTVKECKTWIEKKKREGFSDFRIYEEDYSNKDLYSPCECDEDCILSIGAYPN